jgi:hypothetical protein
LAAAHRWELPKAKAVVRDQKKRIRAIKKMLQIELDVSATCKIEQSSSLTHTD